MAARNDRTKRHHPTHLGCRVAGQERHARRPGSGPPSPSPRKLRRGDRRRTDRRDPRHHRRHGARGDRAPGSGIACPPGHGAVHVDDEVAEAPVDEPVEKASYWSEPEPRWPASAPPRPRESAAEQREARLQRSSYPRPVRTNGRRRGRSRRGARRQVGGPVRRRGHEARPARGLRGHVGGRDGHRCPRRRAGH